MRTENNKVIFLVFKSRVKAWKRIHSIVMFGMEKTANVHHRRVLYLIVRVTV